MTLADPRRFLRSLFDDAVAAADPMQCVPAALPLRPAGRVVVIGAGKASARMAEAVESAWGPCEGLVLTRYGYGRATRGIEIVEAAHPVPDARGLATTTRTLKLLAGLGEDDFVLALVSGGGSALLVQPAGDITLAEKQAVNDALLTSGAPIGEMNIVRKHLSRVKGGQLAAAAWPARMLALIISDIPGDDPALIASGPTVGDDSTPADARAILDRWHMSVPPSVEAVLAAPTGVLPPDAVALARSENRVIAAPRSRLRRQRRRQRSRDAEVRTLGDALEGEARDVAADQARLAQEFQPSAARPVLLLSGGECTVTRRGDGVGGPNSEFCLEIAVALAGAPGICGLACDTDGVDGAAEVAGAIVTSDTLTRAKSAGIDPAVALARNDAHGFFEAIGDQVVTGPTLTNVNDFRAILVEPA